MYVAYTWGARRTRKRDIRCVVRRSRYRHRQKHDNETKRQSIPRGQHHGYKKKVQHPLHLRSSPYLIYGTKPQKTKSEPPLRLIKPYTALDQKCNSFILPLWNPISSRGLATIMVPFRAPLYYTSCQKKLGEPKKCPRFVTPFPHKGQVSSSC